MTSRKTALSLAVLLMVTCSARAETRPAPDPDLAPILPQANAGSNQDEGALASQIKFCVSARELAVRLKCFEDMAAKLGAEVQPAVGQAPSSRLRSTSWIPQVETGPTGIQTITIGLQASEVLSPDGIFAGERAVLFLRCEKSQSSLYINFSRPITPKQTQVFIAMDGGAAVSYTWTPSISEASIGVWTTQSVAPLAKWLSQGTRISVKVVLPGGRSATAIFDVAGMSTAMQPVRGACGW